MYVDIMTWEKLSSIVATMVLVYWEVQTSSRRVKDGKSFQSFASFTLLKKIWFKIQVVIYPLE